MPTSNVRSIDSLEAFRAAVIQLSEEWDGTLQEVRMVIHRAEDFFAQDRPAYWRRQTQLAERVLTEAKDNLSRKRASIRPADTPAATEAFKRVQAAERRLRECEEKSRKAKKWAVEISRHCEGLLGPLADVVEHCEVVLPSAAVELQTLIDQLRAYAEQSRQDKQT